MVTIVCANKPPVGQNHKYWCCVLPDEATFPSMREEIRTGKAWNALLNATRQEPHPAASLPAEDQKILRHCVAHHNLNPSQALAVRRPGCGYLLQGDIPPRICEGTTSRQSKIRWPIIRSEMANLHVPSIATVLSLQREVWSPQGEGCFLGGPPVRHKLGLHSASWMSPRGIAFQWVSHWPLLGHSACFVGMPVNCAHTVPSLFWQRNIVR